jgi:hypothetical protein
MRFLGFCGEIKFHRLRSSVRSAVIDILRDRTELGRLFSGASREFGTRRLDILAGCPLDRDGELFGPMGRRLHTVATQYFCAIKRSIGRSEKSAEIRMPFNP